MSALSLSSFVRGGGGGGGVKGEEELLKVLEQLTIRCGQDEVNRAHMDLQLFRDVSLILQEKRGLPSSSPSSSSQLKVEAQLFRFLRNGVAGSKKNQDFVRESTPEILEMCSEILREFIGEEERGVALGEEKLVVQRCVLQFITNFMVDNGANAELVLRTVIGEMLQLLKISQDEKTIQYGAMAYHVLLTLNPSAISSLDDTLIDVLLKNAHLEFVVYTLESLATNADFMTHNFLKLSIENRIRMLKAIGDHSEIHPKLPVAATSRLSHEFQDKSDLIMKSRMENSEHECWEVTSILELLCSISALDDNCLKMDTSLCTTAMFLLKSVHSVGKVNPSTEGIQEGSNTSEHFAPVEDLGSLRPNSDNEEIRGKPTFQFKANLIRLIANLMHQNPKHQDLVRETETLQVILDSCKLDARNPFITQWAVLAIRNACEGNLANQEVVKSIQQIDTAEAINQNKVKLVTLE